MAVKELLNHEKNSPKLFPKPMIDAFHGHGDIARILQANPNDSHWKHYSHNAKVAMEQFAASWRQYAAGQEAQQIQMESNQESEDEWAAGVEQRLNDAQDEISGLVGEAKARWAIHDLLRDRVAVLESEFQSLKKSHAAATAAFSERIDSVDLTFRRMLFDATAPKPAKKRGRKPSRNGKAKAR